MRGDGEHELKATLVALAPARTCSSTGQLQQRSIWISGTVRACYSLPARLCHRVESTDVVYDEARS